MRRPARPQATHLCAHDSAERLEARRAAPDVGQQGPLQRRTDTGRRHRRRKVHKRTQGAILHSVTTAVRQAEGNVGKHTLYTECVMYMAIMCAMSKSGGKPIG